MFSSDELPRLKLYRFPCFLIINIAEQKFLMGHWLALRISQKSVEIFDSLGFSSKNWGRESHFIEAFIDNYRVTHKILTSPVLQPLNSYTCGYYCVFFVLFRSKFSFKTLTNKFSTNYKLNDDRVLNSVFRKINQ